MSSPTIAMGLYDKFNNLLAATWPGLSARRVDVRLGGASWSSQLAYLEQRMQQDLEAKRKTLLRLALKDDANVPVDKEVATGALDPRIVELAELLDGFPKEQATVTIGLECNGPWNGYTPYVFPLAWRRIMNRVDSDHTPAGLCSEPSAPADLLDGPFVAGAGKWWPGDKYVQVLEADIYTLSALTGPETTPDGKLTKHGRLNGFANLATVSGRPLRVTECAMSDVSVMDTVKAKAWLAALFDWLRKHRADRLHWNNVDYGEKKFQDTDWAKGWKDSCINHNPEVQADFVTRALAFTTGVVVEPESDEPVALAP